MYFRCVLFVKWLFVVVFTKVTDVNAANPNGGQPFPVAFYKIVEKSAAPNDNIVISPFSLEAALAVCFLGARGITRDEIATVLGIPSGNSTTAVQKFATKFQTVDSAAENYVLASANAIYLEMTYEINPEFQQTIEQNFTAKIVPVDFKNQPDAARENINTFVESKTNNRIRDLFAKGTIDSTTRMVVVNAVYFKADWDNQFNSALTSSMPFFHANGQTDVKMMQNEASFLYSENVDLRVQMLEIPYKLQEMSMIILLPKENTTAELEKNFSPDLLSWRGSRAGTNVKVFLPKFKLEKSYDLIDQLKDLGTRSAFSDAANFTGISGEGALQISKVVQKVFIGKCQSKYHSGSFSIYDAEVRVMDQTAGVPFEYAQIRF